MKQQIIIIITVLQKFVFLILQKQLQLVLKQIYSSLHLNFTTYQLLQNNVLFFFNFFLFWDNI